MDFGHHKGGWGATLGAGGRAIKAAGGLTLRGGDSASASSGGGPAKLVSIAVVGLSGGEKEKGSIGSGKSCLCNRFIQPLADDYSVDHISVFSQSDFSGRVVNNDHFLYWGDVKKSNDEGIDFHIQVVEQTEFIDDASFQPFRGSGKSESYIKRCSNTKLVSAEKLMYICKDQLGIEREYEQKLMPDGRIAVDGFVCVYDVSAVPNRSPERQTEFLAQVLNSIIRVAKKPVVIAATKCDEANEVLVRELERLVNRKDLKQVNIPVVETSSHEGVNVDAAFFAVAQLVDKTRGRSRILSYYEAAHYRREQLDMAKETFLRLIRMQVTDYGVLWSTALKKLCQFAEYQVYTDLFGRESAHRLFQRHVKALKEEYLRAKVQRYFDLIPEVLHQMFPAEFDSLDEGDWELLKDRIRGHPDFNRWFVEYPEDTTWMEADLFMAVEDASRGPENRIPFDVLEMPDAEAVYKNHVNQLHAHQKRLELRKDFKQLLEEMGCVTPGKNLNELRVLFLGRECFENLPEADIQEIYDLHQRELIQRSKKAFQELLLERADLFYQFRSSPMATVTQNDILDITEALQEDSRFKALDRLDADRKLLLFQHLGFVTSPMREHCHSGYLNCTDTLVERIVAAKTAAAGRPASWSRTTDNNHLNLVVLGVENLADELADRIRTTVAVDDEFEHQNQIFSLDYRTVSGDVSLPENAFRTQDFLPHGCFCAFSNPSSFEYIRDSLEKTLLSNLEQEDRLPFQGLPLVIVFAAEPGLSEKDLQNLREEGSALAESLQSPFIDVSQDENRQSQERRDPSSSSSQLEKQDSAEISVFNERMVEDALRALIESIRHRSGILSMWGPNNKAPSSSSGPPSSNNGPHEEPDIRIIMCMLCGDPYSLEHVLGPLLTTGQQNCYVSGGQRSICIETTLVDPGNPGGGASAAGATKRCKVEVVLSSYHGASDFRNDLVHGFILVYSTKRRASLANLSALSVDVPELPLQILAVTNNSDIGLARDDECTYQNMLAQESSSVYGGMMDSATAAMISEGRNLADRLNAHFATTTSNSPVLPRLQSNNGSFYNPFFREVFEKKNEIEQAMADDDAARLDGDSGEGTLERPLHPIRSHVPHHLPPLGGGGGQHQQARPRGQPQPPPRMDSYRIMRDAVGGGGGPSSNASCSGSEIYERLPGSQGDDLDEDVGSAGGGRDSDVYSSLDRQNGGEQERLVRPSQIKKKQQGWVDDSLFIRRPDNSVGESGSHPVGSASGHHNPSWIAGSNPAASAVGGGGTFTTGRAGSRRPMPAPPPPVKPRTQVPGKLNMGDFHKVSAALTGLKLESPGASPGSAGSGSRKGGGGGEDDHGYAVPKDNVVNAAAAAANGIEGGSKKGPAPLTPTQGGLVGTPVGSRVPVMVADATTGNEYAQPIALKSSSSVPGSAATTAEQTNKPTSKSAKQHRERREQLALQNDSDSDSESSSDEGGSSGGGNKKCPDRRPTGRSHRKSSQGGAAAPAPGKPRGVAIPVATPIVPQLPKPSPQQQIAKPPITESDKTKSTEDFSKGEDGSFSNDVIASNTREMEKQRKRLDKELKQRQKDAERKKLKDEKKRQKEADKLEAKERKKEKKESKVSKANSVQVQPTLEDFRASSDDPVPVFLAKAITYIEAEGLDAEGLYRVPGNRAHVDLLFQKFDEDHNVDIAGLDIAVNAVATAVKDFFFKRLPPVLPEEQMTDLESVSSIADKSIKMLELGKLLKRLPRTNFAVLKYIFQHLVKVTEYSKENCMDSKNLAICWWPTLLQYEFGDLGKFEAMRPHLEDVVQLMIDQFRFLYCGQEEIMMV